MIRSVLLPTKNLNFYLTRTQCTRYTRFNILFKCVTLVGQCAHTRTHDKYTFASVLADNLIVQFSSTRRPCPTSSSHQPLCDVPEYL